MDEKLENILELVEEYISDKRKDNTWQRGEWVKYSGPNFDASEYKSAIKSLLSEWLILGKIARDFEGQFPKYLGKKHGVLTNSGSSANLLMVSALSSRKINEQHRIPKGSKFITPVVCFPTTLNPLIQNGYEPVFVDVELPSLNLNLDEVENILKNDTNKEIKGIIFAHVLGNPPNMDRLMSLVEEYGLIFLEDACDALGSYYDGKKLGSFGHLSTCSFFPAHHMTMGEGGFVATDKYQYRRALASMRDWGRACYCNEKKPGDVTCATACGNRFNTWFPDVDIVYDHRYVFDDIGYNLKPLDLQAAMGLEQLKKLPQMDEARRQNFKRLRKVFERYKEYFILPDATENSDPCWFGFLLTVKDSAPFKKQDIQNWLETNKIQTRSYFTGNALYHPAYNHLAAAHGNLQERFPVAHKATIDTFFLGTFIGMTEEKINYIAEVVDEYFNNIKFKRINI